MCSTNDERPISIHSVRASTLIGSSDSMIDRLAASATRAIDLSSSTTERAERTMRQAVYTSLFMASMREAARVSSTDAFQFVRRSQRGGTMKSSAPISAASAAMCRSVATCSGSR